MTTWGYCSWRNDEKKVVFGCPASSHSAWKLRRGLTGTVPSLLCDIDHLRLHVAIPFWHGHPSTAPENARRTGRRRVVPARFRDDLNSCDGDRSGRGRSRGRGRHRGRGRGRTRPASAIPDGESAQEDREARRAAARACYRARRDRESPQETEALTAAVRASDRARRDHETEEQAEARRASVGASNHARRDQESEEQAEARRASVRASNRARRDQETEEEAEARRASVRAFNNGRKSPLTTEMRVAYVMKFAA